MSVPTLMIQGTTSDAGKSALVTGICRLLARRGIRVAPFKPQNMALNSAVTGDGGEIGRAQAIQARACGLAPHTDMNPVLLKPNSDAGSQVIVRGRAVGNMPAREYERYKPIARAAVLDAYRALAARHQAILVEGAGSPAEINLRANDIANMGFAEAIDCPVLLVADIDRGGVFAHLVGTLALLSPSERARVRGFVINRFRGDPAILQPGLDWLEGETGKPVFGVLPYLHGLHLDAEDGRPRNAAAAAAAGGARSGSGAGSATGAARAEDPETGRLRAVVPVTPRISNHTDFDPLRLHPGVDLRFVGAGEPIPPADLILLPGSKSVRADLAWLRDQGWEPAIRRHLRYGGRLIGLCGGFQMLGTRIEDPLGLEGPPGTSPGLGLLDLTTRLAPDKQLRNTIGRLTLDGSPVAGYEIHAGVTTGPALARPALMLTEGPEGAVAEDGQILGTYLHGLFDSGAACGALLAWAGLGARTPVADHDARREEAIDRLADAVEAHLDLKRLLALLA